MIGFLNAYHWDGDPSSYQVKYGPMATDFIQKAFPSEKIKVFELPIGNFPTNPEECEIWIISGSSKSAYENDAWILKLKEFVKLCDEKKQKLVGFCFGHQIVAEALGGKVEKSSKGWGIGIREFHLKASSPWMSKAFNKVLLLYSHQDQVSALPSSAIRMGESDFCENEAFSVGEHILCFQGHPEFTKEYAAERYNARKDKIGLASVDKAMETLTRLHPSKEVWDWIVKFKEA